MGYVIFAIGGLLALGVLAVLVLLKYRLGPNLGVRLSLRVVNGLEERSAAQTLFDALACARLREPAEALRSTGFFASFGQFADEDLARHLHQRIESRIEMLGFLDADPERPTNWWSIARKYKLAGYKDPVELDLLAAGEDPSRIWWEDLDQVRPHRNGYVKTLQRWAEISRGAFQPEGISESWGAEGESVFVSFQLSGVEHVFIHLTGHDPQIDTAGLRAFINPLIADAGIQFEIVAVQGVPNIVTALTIQERAYLQNVRGWRFAEIPAVVI